MHICDKTKNSTKKSQENELETKDQQNNHISVSIDPTKQIGIKCISTNTDTLTNKMEELETLVHEHGIDIITICETLPKNTQEDKDNFVFNMPGYKVINNNTGRGICMFIKDNIDFVDVPGAEDFFSPSIYCKIMYNKTDFFILGLIYRSEDKCTQHENDKLNEQIDYIVQKYPNNKIVIVGDFNFPDIDWYMELSNKPQDHKATKFLNTIQDNYLNQCINEPTHHKPNTTPSLIDLILCNDPDFVNDVQLLPPLGKSHHSVVYFNLPIQNSIKVEKPTVKFQINKGDYNEMRKYVDQVDWDTSFEGTNDAGEMVDILDRIVTKACDKFIPKKAYRHNHIKRNFTAPPTLLLKLQLKRSAFKKYKQYPTIQNYNEYVRLRNDVKMAVKHAKKANEERIARDAKRNPKAFYQYVASKSKTKTGVCNLTKEDGTLTLNDSEKAEVLSNFFSSVFTKDKLNEPVPDFNTNVLNFLSKININKEHISKALNSLKVDKSPGPDNMHPRVLKELSHQLAYPLLLIFKKSMEQGKLPYQWKVAEVRPIFKKGCKSKPGNYRPVSLTSIICKVFEGFVRDALYDHLVKNNLLSPKQFGFCQGRSCVTQLLNTINKWMKCLDNSTPVDAIYLDFAKAFDTVPHKRLIAKLEGYGVKGDVLMWIQDFLANRTQYVSVNGERSTSMPVSSGVPQGSVLGPILFVYFINDMPSASEEDMNLFADDAKAFKEIQALQDQKDLQRCINALVKWSIKWGMGFNGCKCKVMHLGRNNPKYDYTISDGTNTHTLEETVCEKDLGVHVDNVLSFDSHISLTAKKARKSAGMLLRAIEFKTPFILVPLFKSLVRPILEYANTVWSPHKRKHIDLLEKVQRSFTKRVIGMYDLEYSQRLERLGLPSLEYRRMRGDLIETYKVLHEIYDPITTRELLSLNTSNTRGHNFKLSKNSPHLNTYKYFFVNRIVNLWNQLPSPVVNSPSINIFKNGIDSLFQNYMYTTNIDVYTLKV